MMQRIVVTAAGVISPLGAGIGEFANSLYAGRTAIAPGERFNGAACARMAEFNPQPWLGNKGIRVLDRSARLLSVAAQMALTASGLSQEQAEQGDPELGLVCGTMFGSVHSITAFDWSGVTEGPNYVNPMEFPNTVINSPAGQAAIKHKLRGVNSTVCAGIASGLHALNYAADFLRFGRARALLAGGVEESCEESLLGFAKLGIESPTGNVRPFGTDRDGTAPGEGSALWMVETGDNAQRRGTNPVFEICGFGTAHDAHSIRGYHARAEAASSAIAQALENSGIAPEQVALVVASANGSPAGDRMEARALRNALGDHALNVPVCAPKAAIGETMGAGGAFAAVTAGLALERQMAPPTSGFTATDCDLNLADSPQAISGEYALVNAFGCDGNNASLVIRLWKN